MAAAGSQTSEGSFIVNNQEKAPPGGLGFVPDAFNTHLTQSTQSTQSKP